MAEKNNFRATCSFYEDYIAGLAEAHTKGYAEGRESLATEILLILKECPNNVTRIDRIRERCNAVLGLDEPKAD